MADWPEGTIGAKLEEAARIFCYLKMRTLQDYRFWIYILTVWALYAIGLLVWIIFF